MKISVRDAIHNKGQHYPVKGEISYQPMDFGGELRFDKPVEVNAEMTCIGESIELEGTLTAAVTLNCNRCNKAYTLNMELPILETFKAQPDADSDAYGIGADDSIDLCQPVLGAILLDIPIQRLCSASCKGLCPVCGANKNEVSCSCKVDASNEKDNPFAQLLRCMDDEETQRDK